MANDLHHDDALWLWAVKSAHVFMEWRMKGIIDPVLHRLFAIGLFNWMGEDDCLHQTTSAMHHATVMGVSLFRRIVENDAKVCLFAFCNLCKKANIVLARQALGAKGHLPSGYSVSLLWVLKQFAWQITTGQMLGSFKKYPLKYPVGIL